MSYDIEKYAEAMEALALLPHRPFKMTAPIARGPEETPEQYAWYLHHYISHSRALMSAAKMLRMSPSALYTVYPAYFPNPEEDTTDDRQP